MNITRNYSIKQEPRGQIYEVLINAAARNCEFVTLIVRPKLGLSSLGMKVLELLRPFLIEQKEVDEWPGTKLLQGSATLLKYCLNESVAQILKTSAEGLFDWQQHQLPEDIGFLKGTGHPWLVSISHEHDAWLILSRDEYIALDENWPELYGALEEESLK
jgi:hypothetical protein